MNGDSVKPATSLKGDPDIKRVLTALVALPLLILFTCKASPTLFAVLVVLFSGLGLHEFYSMTLPDRKIVGPAVAVLGALTPLLLYATPLFFPAGLTAVTVILALVFLFTVNDLKKSAADFALTVSGLLYVPLLLGHLLLLRGLNHGINWIFLLFVLVMSGDSAAYYTGRSLGRHKLYPLVSPNKSIEGALGGLAGSLLGSFISRWTFFPELTAADCLLTAMIIGPLGQCGDLFESLVKRSCGVKDSGFLVPGHGGILDRLDSILFAAPALYYYARYLAG